MKAATSICSDGGHFENLWLSDEMVRRRCRFIVVIDAGCDPNFAFEDLGNAAWKIFIDLGTGIVFDGPDKLSNRSANAAKDILYHAIGIIDYRSVPTAPIAPMDTCSLSSRSSRHRRRRDCQRSNRTCDTFPLKTPLISGFPNSVIRCYRSLGVEINQHHSRPRRVDALMIESKASASDTRRLEVSKTRCGEQVLAPSGLFASPRHICRSGNILKPYRAGSAGRAGVVTFAAAVRLPVVR